MTNRPRPYYGFSCLEFSHQLRDIVKYAEGNTDRRLMLGTSMSSRSLRGFEVKSHKRTLQLDQVRGVYTPFDRFCDTDNWFRVIHFNSDSSELVDSELLHVDRLIHDPPGDREIAILERLFNGFQINDALPNPDNLRWFQFNHLWPNRFEIILQLGDLALRRADKSPAKLAMIVEQYKGVVDYILLDASGGRGQALDPEWARPYLSEIKNRCPWVGLGVAGGLGPDTLHLVYPLVKEFPDLSIDAEHNLRDDKEDNFDVSKAIYYFHRAMKIFEPDIILG